MNQRWCRNKRGCEGSRYNYGKNVDSKLVYLLKKIETKLAKERCIVISCHTYIEADDSTKFFRTYQIEADFIITLPNELPCCSINKVTNVFRKSGNLHVIVGDKRQNQGCKGQPSGIVQKAMLPKDQPSLPFFNDKIKVTCFSLSLRMGKPRNLSRDCAL